MPKEMFFSSYRCDCGHQIDFSENTVGEVKQKSKRKRQWLIETCEDPTREHVVVFDGGEMVDILCPDDGGRRKKTKFTKKWASSNKPLFRRGQTTCSHWRPDCLGKAAFHGPRQ